MDTNIKLIACLDCSKGCGNCPLKILPEKTCKKMIENVRTRHMETWMIPQGVLTQISVLQ